MEEEKESGLGTLPASIANSEIAEKLLVRLFGPVADETGRIAADLIGRLAGDRIHAWRKENLVRNAYTSMKNLHNHGINLEDTRPLPIRDWPKIVEAMSTVDQEALSDMWAGLIARAMHPDRTGIDIGRFSRTISSLAEDDALLFSTIIMTEQLDQILAPRRSRLRSTIYDLMKVSQEAADKFGENEKHWLETHVTPITRSFDDALARIGDQESLELAVDVLLRQGLVETREQPSPVPIPAININSSDLLRRGIDPSSQIQHAFAAMASAMRPVVQPRQPVVRNLEGLPHFSVRVTGWGHRVAEVCGIGLSPEQIARVT